MVKQWFVVEVGTIYGPFTSIIEATLGVKYLCDSRGGEPKDYPIVTRDRIEETVAKNKLQVRANQSARI